MPRHPETLVDPAIDRELEALLDVAPSGEFAARVRTAMAGERPASRWWPSWQAVALPAGVLSVALVAWMLPSARSADATRKAPLASVAPQRSATVPERPASPVASLGERLPAEAVVQPPRPRRLTERASVPAPEVLISQEEVRAYRALVARPEPLQMELVKDVVAAERASADTAPLDVAPIVVKPLAAATDRIAGGY